MSVCVWLKPVNGNWASVGEAGSPRVVPGSVHLEADDFGPSTGTFTINVDSRQPVPGLTPYSKCVVEIDGMRVWSGFVQSAPRVGRQIAVTVQGSQMISDDPLAEFVPVDNRLSMWDDTPTVLGRWDFSGSERSGGAGGLTMGWSQNTTFDFASYSAFVYTGRLKHAIAIQCLAGFSATVSGLFLIAIDYTNVVFPPHGAIDSAEFFSVPVTQGAVYEVGVATEPARKVAVGLWGPAGTVIPAGFQCTIYGITMFERTAYESGGASILTGRDLADRAYNAMLGLSPDKSQMQPSSFQAPAYYSDQPQSPRKLLKDAAGLDDTLCKIDALDRLVFKPRPSAPTIELPPTTPGTQETPFDPSTLAASVVLSGQNDTQEQERRVTILDLPETPRMPAGATFLNPSFADGATDGWVVSDPTMTFGVGSLNPPPGQSFKYATWTGPGSGGIDGTVSTVLTGKLEAGVPVVLRFWAFDFTTSLSGFGPIIGSSFVSTMPLWLFDANNRTSFFEFQVPLASGTITPPYPWQLYEFSFVPEETWTAPVLDLYSMLTKETAWPDGTLATSPRAPVVGDFSLWVAAGPLAGQQRAGALQVPAGATDDWARTLGQTYLRTYNRLGYTVDRDVADGQARDAITGAKLPACVLLSHTAETARLSDRLDPQTAAQGAQGHISQVAYEHAERRAKVSLGQRYGAVDEYNARLTALSPPQ